MQDWIQIRNKKNRNSVIFRNKEKTLFMKRLLWAVDDFRMLNEPDHVLLSSKKVLVMKELKLLLLLRNFLQERHLPGIALHDSWLSSKGNIMNLNMVFDYIPFQMGEYIKKQPTETGDVILQIFFQCYYMDLLGIHHGDLHAGNIMVQPLPKPAPICFYFEGKYYEKSCKTFCYLIDFGLAYQDFSKSNFPLFCNFVWQLQSDLQHLIFRRLGKTWQETFSFFSESLTLKKMKNLKK